MQQKIRLGMIGGGPGAFIGAIHRIAANMDGQMEWVCGAFSSDPAKSKTTGAELCMDPSRVYDSYADMITQEKALPVHQRMQVVCIVTPNHLHFEPAKMSIENGFHVVLDKPISFNLAEAKALAQIVQANDRLFCLTHTYTGYPMLKEARQQIQSGKLGNIRKIYVEYPQGWLSTFLEGSDQKQAAWRTDPSKSGAAGALGDIGTHAFNLAEYVSGLQVTHLCADVNIVVAGRKLDDDVAVLLKFNNGASGVLTATQIAAGEENNIKLRVYGERGSMEWSHADCNSLQVKWLDKPAEIWRAGTGYLGAYAQANTRTPAGHPEGYLEAFANLYRNFANCVAAKENGQTPKAEWLDYPGVEEGVRGMLFVETVLKSGTGSEKWTAL